MPQSSYAYAVARVRVLEGRLLTKERLARLAEADAPPDALRLLQEFGYGAAAGDIKSPDEYDKLILEELREAYALIERISPDPGLTGLFRLQYDAHNLKVLLKQRLLEDASEEAYLMDVGTVPVDKLKACVLDKRYSILPEPFKAALNALEKSFSSGVIDPAAIGRLLDKAVFQEAFRSLNEKPNKFAKAYFAALADFQNVRILLRAKTRNSSKEELAEALLPQGGVPHSRLIAALEMAPEALIKAVSTGPVMRGIQAGLEDYFRTESMAALERRADDYLLDLAKGGKRETLGIGPLIGYLLAREQEAKAVRLVMVAKLNGLDEHVVKERMRELYI